MNFKTLVIIEAYGVAHIEMNRPDKANALNGTMWKELKIAFDWLNESHLRVGVLSARGKNFTAGIDFDLLAEAHAKLSILPEGKKQEQLKKTIAELQGVVNAVENCQKPILAAIHGACIGAGVALICACDLRYSTLDARFSVKEVDMAIVADLGTLQRLPKLVGDGFARELAYTGREFDGNEAHEMKLVNRIFMDKNNLMTFVLDLAADIASKSPMTIRGIKDTLNYSRDHTVAEGLGQVAARNASTLFSSDFAEAMVAAKQKRAAIFDD